MKSQNTKRTLLSSILSMVLCMAMLAGSTFAWFTDSVTSAGNIIKSGTLDVEMQWADGTKSLTAADTEWKDAAEGAIFNYDRWEPGYTEVRHIKINNVGNLALKYDVHITPTGEAGKLADVIDVYYIQGGAQIEARANLENAVKVGTLADVLKKPYVAKGHISGKDGETISSDVATIAFKMQESAGNEYQNLSIGSEFAIQLRATQYTKEQDSFDDQYDAEATYPIAAAVNNAINQGALDSNAEIAKLIGQANLIYFDNALRTDKDGAQAITLHFGEGAMNAEGAVNAAVSAVIGLIDNAVDKEAANVYSVEIGHGRFTDDTNVMFINGKPQNSMVDGNPMSSWVAEKLLAMVDTYEGGLDGAFVAATTNGLDVEIVDMMGGSQIYRMYFDIADFNA